MNLNPAKRLIKKAFNRVGLNVSRMSRADGGISPQRLDELFQKYKDHTMLGRYHYVNNLTLAASVTSPGCVIECGVWKGGSIAGMAEVLGPDREYFLFDTFQGHPEPPQPIDGPAALAWKGEKSGPWHFDMSGGTAGAEEAMKASGAKHYHLIRGVFDDTLPTFMSPSPIAVLRIDCDWYASTMTCLRALFPQLAEDGILIADGYPDWDGYARAIHEYLAGYEGMARIKQFRNLYYIVKGERKWEFPNGSRR
jgi:O-methyltransferase